MEEQAGGHPLSIGQRAENVVTKTNRRQFLVSSAAAMAASSVAFPSWARGDQKQSVLVMGGTAFLGPPIVERLVADGHKVTLFNRGKTNPGLFPDLEKLIGDRKSDVKALEGRKFDAVIDTNGYFPAHVEKPLSVLKDNIGHYVFVSTVSVYPEMGQKELDESSTLAELSEEAIAAATAAGKIGADYGALKVACERMAEKLMPGKVTVVRPGLIVGDGDPTDRFTYWPARVAQGGEVLAPGKPEWEIQIADVRDVGDFCVHTAVNRTPGIFNVDGPEKPIAMGDVLEACKRVTKSDAKFTWVDVEFLAEQGVQAWADLPAWFPPQPGQTQVPAVSCKKAIAAGLKFRPIDKTIEEALEHHRSRGENYKPKWRLTAEREAEVLKAWHAKIGS